ncbi:GFA family protein [Vibrio sp. SCSIO 43136]|uniref:GFA family protein n=1 Tax=Vibrio sp. SCSIO 43136 TaxID=2819101 RepID=UPI002074ED5A|nr:GFA family protein [Vibrio sp. SCSIO 43136]USD67672.1 GFA family protein [Vibrio sp. SCSIO 43136]
MSNYPITAKCQCGQVGYHLKAAPLKVFACHCTECQKLSTAPFSVTVVVDTQAVEFFGEMREWSRSADSGNRNNAKFCPNCGNRIYHYNPEDTSTMKLKLKPVHLDDPLVFAPQAHVWTCEKLTWVDIPPSMTCFDKQP